METNKQIPSTGVIQSPEDYRYVNVEHLAGSVAESSPKTFHIVGYDKIPDLNQKKRGACTNHATAELVMHRFLRISMHVPKISPRFSYTLCKIEDGVEDKEYEGTYPVMPLKIGVKYGFATEETIKNDTTLDFPAYIYKRDIRNIPNAAFVEARKYKIPGYAQVGKFKNVTLNDLKKAIIKGLDGVKTCLPIGSEWWTAKDGRISWDKKDILPIRKVINEVSGHDITVTGFEDEGTRTKIYFRNHWGLTWADSDNGWFYFDKHILTEAWIISEIPDPLLAILKSLPAQKDFTYAWNADLKVGIQNDDVKNLQIALKIVGVFPFNQPVTNYFGEITRKAVMDFQRMYKVTTENEIISSNGAFGPKTRLIINKLFTK